MGMFLDTTILKTNFFPFLSASIWYLEVKLELVILSKYHAKEKSVVFCLICKNA